MHELPGAHTTCTKVGFHMASQSRGPPHPPHQLRSMEPGWPPAVVGDTRPGGDHVAGEEGAKRAWSSAAQARKPGLLPFQAASTSWAASTPGPAHPPLQAPPPAPSPHPAPPSWTLRPQLPVLLTVLLCLPRPAGLPVSPPLQRSTLAALLGGPTPPRAWDSRQGPTERQGQCE